MNRCDAALTLAKPSPLRSLTRAIGRLARVGGQFGTKTLLQLLLDRLARRLIHFRADNLVCFDVDQLVEPSPIELGLTFRFLTPAELQAFSADHNNQIQESMAQRAAAGQDLCFGVLADGRLAGYGWCALDCIEPEHCGGVAMSYPSDVAYMYMGFTHAEFRGKRLNGLRVLLAGRELAKRGIRRLVALVDWTNWSSMRSMEQAGCSRLGRLVTVGMGSRRWRFFPKAAREIGIRFGPHARQRGHEIANEGADEPATL